MAVVDVMGCPEWDGESASPGKWFRVGSKRIPHFGEIEKWTPYVAHRDVFNRARGLHDAGFAETAQARIGDGCDTVAVLLIYFRRKRRAVEYARAAMARARPTGNKTQGGPS